MLLLATTSCEMHRDADDDSSYYAAKGARPRPERASDADPGSAVGGGGGGGAASQVSARRHVIIMIGDGMQLAYEVAASRYKTGRDNGLSFHEFPIRVFKTTWDVDVYRVWAQAVGVPEYSPSGFDPTVGYNPERGGSKPYPLLPDTPDRREYFLTAPTVEGIRAARSSSTGTAMSTGMKTDGDNLAWFKGDPANGALETSAEYLRRVYGMAIGFVTTGPMTHATPGAWFSHNVSRDDYGQISKEMLTRIRPDVMIGGGTDFYVARADIDAAKASGAYVVVERATGLDADAAVIEAAITAKQDQKKLLGIFGGSDGNFMWPVPKQSPGKPEFVPPPVEDPSMAQASVAALEVLAQNPNGFFAMFEQEDIDLANHQTDFARAIGCVHDLDEAVRAVEKFVDRPGDAIDWSNTTLIVTADHANGYLRLLKELGTGELPEQRESDGGWSYPDGTISYGGGGHTNELIAVYVRGRVAAEVSNYTNVYPGIADIMDDTSIYHLTLDAARR